MPEDIILIVLCIGSVQKVGKSVAWTDTIAPRLGLPAPLGISSTQRNGLHSPLRVMAANGDWCDRQSWVLVSPECGEDVRPKLVQVKEVLQGAESGAETRGLADWVLVQCVRVGMPHDMYHMPQVALLSEYIFVRPQVSP